MVSVFSLYAIWWGKRLYLGSQFLKRALLNTNLEALFSRESKWSVGGFNSESVGASFSVGTSSALHLTQKFLLEACALNSAGRAMEEAWRRGVGNILLTDSSNRNNTQIIYRFSNCIYHENGPMMWWKAGRKWRLIFKKLQLPFCKRMWSPTERRTQKE